MLTWAELEERMRRLQGLSFSTEMFEELKLRTLELYGKLRLIFDDLKIV